MKTILLALLLALRAAAADRVALIIGNTIYDPAKPKGTAPNLITADNDANALAALLEKTIAFNVILTTDAALNDIADAVEEAVFLKTSGQQRPKPFLNGNLAPFTTFVFRPGVGSAQPDAVVAARLAEAERELNASKRPATMVDPPQPKPLKEPDAPSFTNSLAMKFVPVPGTDVLFCIHETRSRDFAAFMADRNRGYIMSGDDAENWRTGEFEKVPVGRGAGEQAEQSNHPVANVSWLDAIAFCDWLSKKEGKTYRLPTDREWSVAVGIPQEGNGTPQALDSKIADVYPWGSSFVAASIQGNYADAATEAKGFGFSLINGYRDGFATTAPVMSFPANEFGLYDMGGNLYEWCTGCYEGTDPAGKDRSLTDYRVVRGGSWVSSGSANLLSSYRFSGRPARRNGGYGFRVVVVGRSGG